MRDSKIHLKEKITNTEPLQGSVGKESTCCVGDLGSIPGSGRSPGKGKGFPLQYSGVENSMDYSPWDCKESDTSDQLSLSLFTFSVFFSFRPHGLYSPWNSPGQNTGVGHLSLLQGIFPTQTLNPGLPHGRRILYQLSHKGSPKNTEDD